MQQPAAYETSVASGNANLHDEVCRLHECSAMLLCGQCLVHLPMRVVDGWLPGP